MKKARSKSSSAAKKAPPSRKKKNSGARFKKCVRTMSKRKGVTSPRGLCAAIGRKKYGAQKFAQMAIRGRRQNPPLATLHEGRTRADIWQTGEKQFKAVITGGKKFASEVFTSMGSALAWARGKVHDLAWTSDKIARNRRKAGKQNPEASATRMYEVFHGMPATKVVEYNVKQHVHEWLWSMGELIELEILSRDGTVVLPLIAPDPDRAKFADVINTACTEDGKQIYFTGGDQELDIKPLLRALHLNDYDVRDEMELGRCTKLTYRTRKSFEDEGQVEKDFWHPLGEEHSEGVLPIVVYRPLDPSIGFVGGRYFIAPGERELGGASPGMVG